MKQTAITLLVCENWAWVARRSVDSPVMPGLLECPGGKVEGNETPLGGAVREVYEEAGLDIHPDRFKHRGIVTARVGSEDWSIWLYMVEVGRHERPKDREPTKRNRWHPLPPGGVKKLRNLTPALGVLLALFAHDVKEAYGKAT